MELKRARRRISGLEVEVYTKNYEWCVLEKEMTQVNEELEKPIDYTELYNLAKDLVHRVNIRI